MKRILLLALVAGICFAQNASIYELSGDDAAEGLKLHDAMVKADADYDKWTKAMSKRYGKGYGISLDGPELHEPLEFSPDFKYAVPKDTRINVKGPAQVLPCSGICVTPSWPGYTAIPAAANPIGAFEYEPCGPGKGAGCLVGAGNLTFSAPDHNWQ